jgi:hypothetical protein
MATVTGYQYIFSITVPLKKILVRIENLPILLNVDPRQHLLEKTPASISSSRSMEVKVAKRADVFSDLLD